MRLALAILALTALTSCSKPSPDWQGWVYPDRGEFTRSVPLGAFPSAASCESAARGVVGALADPQAGRFECGRACRWDQEHRTNRCSEWAR